MGRGLTMSIIFEAQSLNYGEGFGNISELKKITRADGTQYTYASRQSLRYDVVRLGKKFFNWNTSEILSKEQGTIQFKADATIKDSPEMDLFGYMKTLKNKASVTRSAVVRLTHAISLEPFKGDIDFLSNKGFADRLKTDSNIANIENHRSFYTYTVSVDLDRVGIDENDNMELSREEKYQRLEQLLEIIKLLNREIKGRVENLSPLFVIGGIYNILNPFFLGRIRVYFRNGKVFIDTEPIKSALNVKIFGKSITENTYIGYVNGIFENIEKFRELVPKENVVSIEEFFESIKKKLKDYYGV